MKLVANLIVFFTTLVGMSKDLMWGKWLDEQPEILGSEKIPAILNKYIPIVAIILFIIASLHSFYTNSQACQNLIFSIRKRFLDRLHKEIFASNSPNQDIFNRITIFTVKPWWVIVRKSGWKFRLYYPWFDYLVITSRTGAFQNSLTSFRIDGDKKVMDNGIAGQSWLNPAIIVTTPKLNPDKSDEYCAKSNIKLKTFNKLNQKSFYYTAFCVRDTNENKIGVIVFDSINYRKITPAEIYSIAKSFSSIHEG